MLLPGQVEWVSTLDLIISFLDIYPRVLVLRIWLQDPWGLLRSFYGVFKKKFFFLIFIIFERERERASGEGAQREGDTESEAGSRL